MKSSPNRRIGIDERRESFGLEKEHPLVQPLRTRLSAYREKVGQSDFRIWRDDYIKRIEQAYRNPEQYYLFHVLHDGMPNERLSPNLDFDGDLSVQKTIESLEI